MKVGLALSGGGIKGAAHIGVLQALEEAGIEINIISGTSAGSIVAMLYSIGYKPIEIQQMFMSFSGKGKKELLDFDYIGMVKTVFQILLGKDITLNGLVKGNKIKELLSQYCSEKGRHKMCHTIIPLAIPAVDINTAKTKMFVSGRANLPFRPDIEYIQDAALADAVRSSIAFPAIFQPNLNNGGFLCDGGLKDNLPLNVLQYMGADKSIGVMLGYSGQCKEDVDNFLEIAAQSVNILSYQSIKNTIRSSRAFIINPHIYDVKLLDFDRIEECIGRGYDVTKGLISEIKYFLH